MFTKCDACGGLATWHPQVHISSSWWSGCVDEELSLLVDALLGFEIPLVNACQDYLHSGRVLIRFGRGEDARLFLDEVIRAAPEEMRLRILEASSPPRLDEAEWSIEVNIATGGPTAVRVVGLPISVSFPSEDLPVVVACLLGDPVAASPPSPVFTVAADSGEMATFVLRDLVRRTLVSADQQAFCLLDLDLQPDEILAQLVGEAWEAPSPGFMRGLRIERPAFLTWLALRAAMRALRVPNPYSDAGTLEEHLAAADLGVRWCVEAYMRAVDPDVGDTVGIQERNPWMSELYGAPPDGELTAPPPSPALWTRSEELEHVTSSPLEMDPNEVRELLCKALVALDNHAEALRRRADRGHFPVGDPRHKVPGTEAAGPVSLPDGVQSTDPLTTADVLDYDAAGTVTVAGPAGSRRVSQGNLRYLIETARDSCRLPGGVAYACALHFEAGRVRRVSFVRCRDDWSPIPARELRVGDRIREDVDYPYVIDQVIGSDYGAQVVLSCSGRGWLVVSATKAVMAQQP